MGSIIIDFFQSLKNQFFFHIPHGNSNFQGRLPPARFCLRMAPSANLALKFDPCC